MTQAANQLSLNGSRLIRLLSELAVSGTEHSYKDFGRRFGQFFSLTESIKLAAMHGKLSRNSFEQRKVNPETIQSEFLEARKDILDSISSRFVATDDERLIRRLFPALRPTLTAEQLATYESYQGFYINLQRQIERDIQHLQSSVRDSVSGISPKLAQLVIIDTTLNDILTAKSRNLFAVVPRLLGQRFDFLRQQHHQTLFNPDQDDPATWLATGGWLDRLRLETHELLLAECDVRLQPVLGLIEAINDDQTER